MSEQAARLRHDRPASAASAADDDAVERFREMLRCPTVWDMRNPDADHSAFDNFIPLLRRLYPRVFDAMELEVIDDYGVSLLWRGADRQAARIVLMAHHDVVRADEGEWTHPPFSSAVGGGKPGKGGTFFYGWWIVIGGFLIMATCYTVFVNCIPLFQTHIVADLGITVGAYNTGVSITTVVAVFASLVFGKLTDKCSAKVLGTFTVLTTAVVLLLMSFITAVWHFYLLCVVAGMVVVAGTRLLVSVLTSNWFTLKRGLAVPFARAGSWRGAWPRALRSSMRRGTRSVEAPQARETS